NKIVSRWATQVCLGFPSMNPIRKEVTQGNHAEGLRITGFSGTRPILLVTGGSQGAAVFNEAVARHIEELTPFCDVAHITGNGKTGAPAQSHYWPTPFAGD